MKNTSLAKTLTASLPGNARDIFTRISDPDNLPQWHPSFCRSLRRENGSIFVESPRGTIPVHFIRDDHSLVLDIVALVSEGVKLTHAIRILTNGEGSEIVWTLVKPEGITDSAYHEHLRWAGNALHALRKAPAVVAAVPVAALPATSGAEATETSEPLQAPSPAEVSSMPLSGKKLFIGNLAYDWTDDQLRAHFVEMGTVTTAEVARFRGRGGRSRGFGFVEMGSEAEAQGAIEKLHGGMAGGRQIIVRLAKSQESRPARIMEPAAEGTTPAENAPEPGNERNPRIPPVRNRSERPRRGGPARTSERPSAPRRLGGGRARPAGSVGRPYQEHDISNKSGYEIFPRRSAGSSEPSRPSEPSSSVPAREPSPYMDDTGDIENHGHRPPRHRRSR